LYHNLSFLFFRHFGIQWITITTLLHIYKQQTFCLTLVSNIINKFTLIYNNYQSILKQHADKACTV
jgi:hypothetical protein